MARYRPRPARPDAAGDGDLERGAIVSPAVADEARRLNAHVRVVHVPGAGHNIRREQYVPFKAAVSEFLKDVSRS